MEKITVITLLVAAFALLSFTQRPGEDKLAPTAISSTGQEWALHESDTLKPTITQTIVKEEDGQVVEMTLRNGEVTELQVDGEEIDPDTQPELVEELREEISVEVRSDEEGMFWFSEGMEGFDIQVGQSGEEGEDQFIIEIESPDGEEEVYEIILNQRGEEGTMLINGEPLIWENEEGNIWSFPESTDFQFSTEGSGNIWINEEGGVWELIEGEGINWAFIEEGDNVWVEGFGENDFEFYFDLDSIPEEERRALEAEMQELSREMRAREQELAEDMERRVREMEYDIRERMEDIEQEAEYLRQEAKRLAAEDLSEEELAEARAAQQEALAELRAEAARMAEEAELLAMVEREMAEQERVIIAEEMAIARAEVLDADRERVWRIQSGSSFQDLMEDELRRDGLWKDGKYRFDLNANRLKINGKKQSNEVHEKYLDLWERATGEPFCEGCHYQINN